MLLLVNTIQNSHTTTMINFHGLTFEKGDPFSQSMAQINRKVKFKK